MIGDGQIFFLLLLLVASASLPAGAQQYEGRVPVMPSVGALPSNLIPSAPAPSSVPIPPELRTIGMNIPLPVLVTQAEGRANENLLGDVIEFNAVMDELLPFCGCNNVVNWPAYNDAVKAAKQLRASLKTAVAGEKKSFSRDATPQQIQAVLKRLDAIDQITAALEKATALLTLLGKSLQGKP